MKPDAQADGKPHEMKTLAGRVQNPAEMDLCYKNPDCSQAAMKLLATTMECMPIQEIWNPAYSCALLP